MPSQNVFIASFLFITFSSILLNGEAKQCSFSIGDYELKYWSDGQHAHFDLKFQNFPNVNAWTGVGFGERMETGIDALIVKVIDGQVSVSDEYVQGYRPSFADQNQNVVVKSASISNGVLHAVFSRPISAGEPKFDHPLNGCSPWKFVTGPGMLHGPGGVAKHTRTPLGEVVCIDKCLL